MIREGGEGGKKKKKKGGHRGTFSYGKPRMPSRERWFLVFSKVLKKKKKEISRNGEKEPTNDEVRKELKIEAPLMILRGTALVV